MNQAQKDKIKEEVLPHIITMVNSFVYHIEGLDDAVTANMVNEPDDVEDLYEWYIVDEKAFTNLKRLNETLSVVENKRLWARKDTGSPLVEDETIHKLARLWQVIDGEDEQE